VVGIHHKDENAISDHSARVWNYLTSGLHLSFTVQDSIKCNVTFHKLHVFIPSFNPLTLILLMWRTGWAPNHASKWQVEFNSVFKRLNAELNPICHLLALLGAHHILHISRIRVEKRRDASTQFGPLDHMRVWKYCPQLTQQLHYWRSGASRNWIYIWSST